MALPLRALLIAAALGLAGCGGSSNHVSGGAGGGGATTSMAATGGAGGADGGASCPMAAGLPQVVTLGGPVLKAPVVQPISYQGDPNATALDAFFQELTTTTYWSQTTAEYGVGPLTVKPTIVQNHAPPGTIDDATLQQHLQTFTSGTNPAWGAADPSTIYLFVIPPGTSSTNGKRLSCAQFDGYHGETQVGSVSVPYAVACSCPGFSSMKVVDIDQRTSVISHELVEAATDPFPRTKPAYTTTDDAHLAWKIVTEGEVGDMCEFNQDAFVIPPGSTYMIQRTWSNKGAKSGPNPCVPVVSQEPYFNSVPVLPDMAQIMVGASTVTAPAIKIDAGATATLDVHLTSTCPTTRKWSVHAYGSANPPNLGLAFDQGTGGDGDTLHLTIKVEMVDPVLGVEPFYIVSSDGEQDNLWMGLVTQ